MKKYAVEKDREQCEGLWKKYIPKEEKLSENWEYNILFHNSETYDLFFVHNDSLFFPLVQEKSTKNISCFPNKRYQHIVLGDTVHIKKNLEEISPNIHIEDIISDDMISEDFQEHDSIYFLDLRNILNWENYIEKFKSEKKSKIRNQVRKCLSQGFEIVSGNKEDLEILFSYNIENFGKDSDFFEPDFQQSYRELFGIKKFSHSILLLKKEGKIYGVSYLLGYKDVLHYMNVGIDKTQRDVGKFLFLSCINLAKEKGYDFLNLGGGDCGWKESRECEKTPLYRIQ